MNNYFTYFSGRQIAVIAFSVLFFVFVPSGANAQSTKVPIPFTQRTSQYQNNKEVYNIRGDYALIGNTNMTLQFYGLKANNSNSQMIYVDVDNDPTTLNSSSATLEFSNENNAKPECSQILYAGLYWAGRSHDALTSANTFNVTKTIQGTLSKSEIIPVGQTAGVLSGFSISIAGYDVIRYMFQTGSSTRLYIEFTGTEPYIRYGTNIASISNYATIYSVVDEDGKRTVTFRPIEVFVPGSTNIVTIDRLTRVIGNNATLAEQHNDASARINVGPSVSVTKQYDKSSVLLKHADAPGYQKIHASDNNFAENIYYPNSNGDYDVMYVGYQDITAYVQQYGVGEYTVADIALREGNGGSVGYYGSWGIVVVYENTALPWRNIVLFDGYAYISGVSPVGFDSEVLTVDGIHAVQEGNVNVKVGILASEGDVNILGDYFQIAKQSNGVPLTGVNDYSYLDRNGQVYIPTKSDDNNFFNSSVQVSNQRYPEITNNTGIDIALFYLPNENKEYVTNNQTSMRFRYGTTLDTYVIYCLVTAVDAYIPEPEVLSTIKEVQGVPIEYNTDGNPIFNDYLHPGDTITYTLEIRNKGYEAIDSLRVYMPVTYTAEYLPALTTVEYFWNSDSLISSGVPANNNSKLIFNPQAGTSGAVDWYVGDYVYISDLNDTMGGLLARITFSIRTTNDCYLLTSSNNCVPDVVVYGESSGRGHITDISFKESGFIYGHLKFPCDDEPITTPHALPIAVPTGCSEDAEFQVRKLQFCIERTQTPYLEIAQYFPAGTRYYNKIDINTGNPPEDDPTLIEYTSNTNFPAAQSHNASVKIPYYAVPNNPYSVCYWTFYIVDVPVPQISVIGENTVICEGTEVNLNTLVTIIDKDSASYPAELGYVNYFYSDPAGATQIDAIVTITKTTTLYYVLTQADHAQCFSNIDPLVITVLQKANVSEDNSSKLIATICDGEAFNIDPGAILDSTIIPNGTIYSWNSPAAISGISGLTSGSNQSTIGGTLTNSNSYPVKVKYTVIPTTVHPGDYICTGESFEVTVTVNPRSTTAANLSTRDTVICESYSVDLTTLVSAVGVTNPVFYWYTSKDGNTQQTQTTVSPAAGTHTYYVSVSGESLCEGEANSNGRKEVTIKVSDCGLTFEIWNWNDLSQVTAKAEMGYSRFEIMQNIGTDATNSGDGSNGWNGAVCPYLGDSVNGWFGYEEIFAGWNAISGWTPITFDQAKTKSFDGRNHTINGLWINRATTDYQGLFNKVENATIKNLTVNLNTNIGIKGRNYVGALVAYMDNNTVVDSCHVVGNIIGTGDNIGILVGGCGTLNSPSSAITSTVRASSAIGNVEGNWYVGGLIGFIGNTNVSSNLTVRNNYSKGTVKAIRMGGGLIGCANKANIYSCYSASDIIGVGDDLGGFIGLISDVTVLDCYSTGSVKANSQTGYGIGGFIATLSSSTITNYITNCYSIGYVDGATGAVGSFIGISNDAVITNCYYNEHSVGTNAGIYTKNNTVGDVLALTTVELIEEMPSGFGTEWNIEKGETYPYLKWQLERNGSHTHSVKKVDYYIQNASGKSEVKRYGGPCLHLENYDINDTVVLIVVNDNADHVYLSHDIDVIFVNDTAIIKVPVRSLNFTIAIGYASQSDIIGVLSPLITVRGTVFPFAYNEDKGTEFDTLFPVTVGLYSVPPSGVGDPIDAILYGKPLYSTQAINYDGSIFVEGTPKYPGEIRSANNPGLPISWERIGRERGTVNNTLLMEGETPEKPVGLYQFENIEAGDYILMLSRPGFIPRFAQIKISLDGVLGHRELIAGDANGNMEIDAHDIGDLFNRYTIYGNSRYKPKYDMNANGEVGEWDVSVIYYNMGASMLLYKDTEEWLIDWSH